MGELSKRIRRRRHKKLTDVLDHQLRIGDQDVSESVIAAYRERGLNPPEHIVAPPAILPEFFIYWEAFRDLISQRTTPRGSIPVNSILEYADRYGLERDQLKRIVWATDRVLLDHWKAQDKIEDAKRKKGVDYKPTIGGEI